MDYKFYAGILIGVLTGIWGVWYSKKLKDRTNVSLVNENWISLLQTFKNRFETLKIEFFELPINTNLYYYKASIINSGTKDIEKGKIHDPLEILFSEDCTVIECRISKQSSDRFLINKWQNQNHLTFDWNLLKPKEFFSFECIVESSKVYGRWEFEKSITTNHRIVDLKCVEHVNAWNIDLTRTKQQFWGRIFYYLICLFFITFFSFGIYEGAKSFFNPDINIKYETVHANDKKPIELKSIGKNKVVVMSNNLHDTININEVNKFITLNPLIELNKNQYGLTIMGIIGVIAFIFMLYKLIEGDYEDKVKIKHLKYLQPSNKLKI